MDLLNMIILYFSYEFIRGKCPKIKLTTITVANEHHSSIKIL